MDFVTPILTLVVESLLGPVKRHLGFLVYSSNKVRDMHAKVSELEGAAQDMHIRQNLNIESSRMVSHRVPGWLLEVEEIKESKKTIPIGGVGCFNLKTRYKAGKDSSDIVKHIDRLMKEKNEMMWTNEIIPLGMVSPPRRSTSTAVHEQDLNQNKYIIESRYLVFNDALKSLEPNNNVTQKMALCGMGGVGKTTMMEDLKKAAKEKKMFDYIVKVEVGQNPNLFSVQKTVAEYLGDALTETSKSTRAERLKRRIQNILKEGKKKILVILDDVWEKFNLEDIGLASPLPNGSMLLLTSRDENICIQMGVEASFIFKIFVLKDEEAKKLFWEITGLGSVSDTEPDLHQIGEDILKRCGGLPIAINTIASTLKVNKKKHAWNDVLNRLQKKTFHGLDLKSIFEISYMNLKENDLKAIFILSSLFPEDYNIDKEDLLKYGWGLNFFKNTQTIATARDRVHTCVDTLIGLNLLIRSDCEECVKMHDLVRDFVLSNFSEVKQASIVSHDNSVSEQLKKEVSYERILLRCGDKFEFCEDFDQPNLRLLTLMDGQLLKFSQDFFTNMENLEVVAYENMELQFLPQYSTNLRVLSLHSCTLLGKDISFIGDLINLEVLGLAHCGIQNLPSKIGKLKKLRLLDLTRCHGRSLCIDDGVIQNLDKLEELYMEVRGKKSSIRFTDANCNELKMILNKLSSLEVEFLNAAQLIDISFEKLERFRISVGCLFGKSMSDWGYRDKYSFKNTLKLVTSISVLMAHKFNELFRKTEMLHLEVKDMSCLEDILTHPPHISFCNLKSLSIYNCGGLTYLFSIPVAKSLTKLESMEIWSCDALRSLVYGENTEEEARVITFSKLESMRLSNLRELVSLCGPAKVILELPKLMELHLEGLTNVTSIFNVNISEKQPLLNKEVVIPKLEKLTISNMENLKEMWPCEITSSEEEVNNISMLRKITVKNCNSLENLFPSNPVQLLSHLEELRVKKCGSIEVLFNIEIGKTKHLSSSSNLRKIEVKELKKLREVWRIKGSKDNYSGDLLIPKFQSVRYLYISRCERFTNIVTPTATNFDFRALRDIRIDGCGEHGVRKNDLAKGRQEQEIINTMSKEEISKVGDNLSVFAFPSNFRRLRRVMLKRFEGLEVVFEIESPINRKQLVTNDEQPLPLLPYLEDLQLDKIDTLTHVWKCNNWNKIFILHKHQPKSSFQNLTIISLSNCKSIKYLFSPLMAKLLSSLKTINILKCHGMEEVVSNRDDIDEEEEVATSATVSTSTALFPYLDLLELSYINNLKHIGGGVTKGETNFSQLDVVHWSLCQHSRKISIKECHGLSSVIPSYAAGRIQKLGVLIIEHCDSMEEVFETKVINNNNTSDRCSTNTVAIPRQKISIVYKLSNLKTLEVHECDCLENIFTFSTLESLKKLETLEIYNCKAMNVIVRDEYGDGTMASSKDVVIFPNLKSIELVGLPNLEGFFLGMNIDFQFPLLEYVMIDDCPQMMVFASGWSMTPRLKYIYTKLGKHSLECGINFHVTPILHQLH